MDSLDRYDLLIFGDFGVLTTTPWKNNGVLEMLPGRAEYLAYLREDRAQRGGPELLYAIAGNKGGVPFGIQSEEAAEAEIRQTAKWIGAKTYRVCFAHPDAKEGYRQYATPEMLRRRKPEPAMLQEIIEELGGSKERVLVVGNYLDDCKAADKIHVAYELASKFFRDAERYVKTAPLALDPGAPPVDDFDPWLDVE